VHFFGDVTSVQHFPPLQGSAVGGMQKTALHCTEWREMLPEKNRHFGVAWMGRVKCCKTAVRGCL